MTTKLLPLLLALALAACLSPRSPVEVHYFSPDDGLAQAAQSPTSELGAATEARVPVQLRRVAASQALPDRLAWRTPGGRIGYAEYDRWSEAPVDTLRRAAAATLDRSRRVVRTEAGGGYALDLELLAFGELRSEPRRAEVALWVELLDPQGRVVVAKRLAEAATVAGEGPAALATELGRLLQGLLWRTTVLVEVGVGGA